VSLISNYYATNQKNNLNYQKILNKLKKEKYDLALLGHDKENKYYIISLYNQR
jgi:hypothetical protein